MPEEVPAADTEPGKDEDGIVEITEEVEPLKTAPSPTMPSAAEVEEHRVTHYPCNVSASEPAPIKSVLR